MGHILWLLGRQVNHRIDTLTYAQWYVSPDLSLGFQDNNSCRKMNSGLDKGVMVGRNTSQEGSRKNEHSWKGAANVSNQRPTASL